MRRLVLALVLILGASWAAAQETSLFYSATASADGSNDTFWVTDARVFNPDTEASITVFLAFLASDTDNSDADEVEITVGPRQAVALNDLVGTLFELSGTGGVSLRSSSPFLATSRTYNTGDGTSGTFGQFISGLAPGDALQQGILLQVVNDPAPEGFRSNIGFLNPGLVPVTVTYRVFDVSTGELLGEGSKDLAPLAFFQVNNVFNAIGEAATVVGNASVEFVAATPVFVYASVVDNTSGDAIFVLPSADSGTPTEENNPPEGTIVTPNGDRTVEIDEPVDFSAGVSDPDGDEVTGMEWDFGDGMTASGLDVSHTYAEVGDYIVTFTATDEHGLADPTPDTRTITVTAAPANNPPEGTIVVPDGDRTVEVEEAVDFVAGVTDPDGDEVTGMDWQFGDGVTASGLSVSHTYAEAGQYTVTFTATDEHGLDDPTPDTRTITVSAAPGVTLTQVQNEIFNQSCAFVGCHRGAAATGGLDLSEGNAYGEIVGVASGQRPSMNRIEPFSAEESYLYLKVTGDGDFARMPLGGSRLSDEELALLRSWIEAGAQDN